MQALRKTDIQAQPSHVPETDSGSTDWAGPRPAGADRAAMSPALLLRDHLAARLDEKIETLEQGRRVENGTVVFPPP